MKRLKKIFWGVLLLFVMLMVFSKAMSIYWGRDVNGLSYSDSRYSFTATRMEDSGAFEVAAKDAQSLWFSMGYVQGWDREFQTELIRLAARGSLSSMLGESVISNDLLMRFNYRAAELVWEKMPVDSLARQAAIAFAEGRNIVLTKENRDLPLEYRIMGLTRDNFEPWTGVDVLAIARFHGWGLSYDHNTEKMYMALKGLIGEEKSKWLQPPTSSDTVSLYEQKLLLKSGQKLADLVKLSSSVKRPSLGEVVIPSAARPYEPKLQLPSNVLPPASEEKSNTDEHSKSGWDRQDNFASSWGIESAFQGASNLWVIADPRVGRNLSLCNDTHLRLTWPAPFYPIAYQIENQVSGKGFMMPGTPAVVIGMVRSLNAAAESQKLLWGITSGSLADTQDLIALSERDLRNVKQVPEEFIIRNMETGEVSTKTVPALWSSFGPVINDIYRDFVDLAKYPLQGKYPSLIALDSPLSKNTPSTLEFFIRRNLFGGKDLEKDLGQEMSYPPLNFVWIHEALNQEPEVGHFLTGNLYGRKNRKSSGLETLSSNDNASKRYVSYPQDRPYFLTRYLAKDPFMLVSSNQGIWSSKGEGAQFHSDLAYLWAPDARAQRIAELFNENVRELGFSQSDFYPPRLNMFFKKARHLANAERLCAGTQLGHSICLKMLSEVDAWDGKALENDFRTTVIALWHANFKWALIDKMLPEDFINSTKHPEAIKKLMLSWQRRTFTHKIVDNVLDFENDKKLWERWSKSSVNEVLIESFTKSINALTESQGELYQYWIWGNRHRISWLHPLVKAPEPIGTMFHEGILVRPPVSGALDSPGRFEYDWDPDAPLEFPATHGAAARLCMEWSREDVALTWSMPSGPSGNPFSTFSKTWSLKTYFNNKLSSAL